MTSAVVKFTLRIVAVLLGLFALAYVASSIFYTRVPEVRLAASDAIGATIPLREELSTRFHERQSMRGIGLELETAKDFETRFGKVAVTVSPDGVIRMKSARPAFEVEMIPTEGDAGMIWHCRGTPEAALPLSCRATSQTDN